jgi:hypothetical protein
MSEECSAAIANGLQKQKDPGCPTIPCSVGSFNFEKALCDLGASVSVMPRDVFEKLRLPLEPTGMCLELGDNSIRYPLGIAEDVPMKAGHHFIPVDVTEPLKLIPYYCLNHSSWPLSNNVEVTCRLCRVIPGKSLTSQDRHLYNKLTRRRVQR